MLIPFIMIAGATILALLAGTGLLHLIPKLGRTGRRLSDVLCRAPGLDLVVAYFTLLPLIVGPIRAGWVGFAGALLGQFVALITWSFLHDMAHPKVRQGPRIIKSINRLVGPVRNHVALWFTAIALPAFWMVRIAEIISYPFLVWTVHFPRYKHAEWINVSRQKFEGLVGHDLIWCLYCDWMTGVWSLGSEMLRNVESFWCPIKFYHGKKCENCRIDFPDVEKEWVDADGTIADAARLWEQKYDDGSATNTWFGHPARMTVEGEAIDGAT